MTREQALNSRSADELRELLLQGVMGARMARHEVCGTAAHAVEIRAALEHGRQVKLSGFGNFDLREKKQRPGRNPKTGEEIPISARRVVTFRPGQKLKARVEAYAGSEQQQH